MQLLVAEHKKEIESVDLEIQALNTKIATFNPSEARAEKERELNVALERSSRETIKKRKKVN